MAISSRVILQWTAEKLTRLYFLQPLIRLHHFTSGVKPWMMQSFLTFGSMDGIPKCDHSLESCLAVLYCGAVSIFSKFINFGLDTVRSERINGVPVAVCLPQ